MLRTSPSLLAVAAFTLASLHASNALATVTQPNGLVVPRDSANGEVQLYTLFQNRGEPIDYQADGHATPDTFSPLCEFTAELVLNQTASVLAVGWYNVDPNASMAPDVADIHVIVPAGSPVGTVISATDIRNDPAYAGGFIGFALVGWQTHYTESQWNPVCSGCAAPGPWTMSVIFASKVVDNAYYITFEDGSVGDTPDSFNNDGDYNDYVYLFAGLACAAGGEPCETGLPGVCATGTTQCDGITCQPDVAPEAEECDGLDNDCNGVTDEGDLCDPGWVCDRGRCVEACDNGEFPCTSPRVCSNDGYCVDPDCVDVICDAGEVCVGGTCKAPCDGVVCPHGHVCRVGACVDPCDGIACNQGEVCDGGVCRTSCACSPCPTGTECETSSGLCKDPSCVDVSCADGTHCEGSQCVDSCTGASCPDGQICEVGVCVDGGAGAAGAAGSGGSGGWSGQDGGAGTGGTGGTGASATGGAGGVSASGGAAPSGTATDGDDGGCGCRVVPRRAASAWGWMALALIAGGGLLRRRKGGGNDRPFTFGPSRYKLRGRKGPRGPAQPRTNNAPEGAR